MEGISVRSISANHYIVTNKSVHASVLKFVMKEYRRKLTLLYLIDYYRLFATTKLSST